MANYHHDINAANFNKWLEEKLLPNSNELSVIVMDNANYLSVIVNKARTTQNLKHEIREWLTLNNIQFEKYHTKAELLCLVKRYKPEPIYEADEILKHNGQEVLRLPPYHFDLNAIELVWSLAKRGVANKNIKLTTERLEQVIKESFENVTVEESKKMTDHVVHVENKYKESDRTTEEHLESFIINVRNSDNSNDSDESMHIDFLDSDFDYSE